MVLADHLINGGNEAEFTQFGDFHRAIITSLTHKPLK